MTSLPPAMVFAAGRGTRMRGLTRTRPKPLIEVRGKALLDHALDLLETGGITRCVVNTHYLGDMVATHLAGRDTPAIDISHEEDLLETGGGLKAARALLGDDPVLTLNADAVWQGGNPVTTLLAGGSVAPASARLLLVPRAAAVGHLGQGDFHMDATGCLSWRGSAATADFVYTGLQLIDPTVVYERPQTVFSLRDIWDEMIAAKRLTGVVFSGQWCDVGHPDSLALAEALGGS